MAVQLANQYDSDVVELKNTQNLCKTLMMTKHYAKLGEDGVFAVIAKAKSMNISPLEALNGGMYYVQGKVEMSGVMMMSIIRQQGHSINLDPKSTGNHVVMHGKRKDNGDTWTASFSIEDAKKAGIYKATWEKYPQAMCIWRCVSMLGRYLFADVIKGCYVQGEISDSPIEVIDFTAHHPVHSEIEVEKINKDQIEELTNILSKCDTDYKKQVWDFWKKQYRINGLGDLPASTYEDIIKGALNRIQMNINNSRLQEVEAQEEEGDISA